MKNTSTGSAGGLHVTGAPLTTSLAAEASPSLLRNAIDERIVRVRPMATPVDQISRCIGSRHCSSMTVEYYSVDTHRDSTLTRAPITQCSFSADDNGNYPFTLQVEDASIFAKSDTVLLPSVDTGNGPFMAYVTGVDNNTVDLYAINSHDLPSMPKGARVVRMGRAAGELDVQTSQFQAMPRKRSNNCQIFKMQIEQSTLQKIASKEVDWNFSDQEESAIVDMRLGMEKNFIFGSSARITAPGGTEHIYFTGGIWNQTSRQTEIPVDNLTEGDLLDLCSKVFVGNNGSKKRILVGGTQLILALNKLSFSRAVMADQSVTRWGIRFREIVSNFGTLYVVHSETFDLCGHSADGFILDPDYITKYTHIPFSKDRIDLRRAGDRNTDAVVLTEASCIVLRHPDAHMRVIGGVSTQDDPFGA